MANRSMFINMAFTSRLRDNLVCAQGLTMSFSLSLCARDHIIGISVFTPDSALAQGLSIPISRGDFPALE